MEIRLLGPFEVIVDDRIVAIPRGRERALLSLLAIEAGEPVGRDRIIEELWASDAPDQAAKSVQIYISRLRKALGHDLISTTGAGYVLRLTAEELDSRRFEQLVAAGRELLEADDARGAVRVLDEALGLWRGEALGDFRFDSFAQDEIRRLDELRATAEADRSEAELALGHPEIVIPRLRQLVGDLPLWERPSALLMRALYAAGRQAEALDLYRETGARFRRELGLEPSTELQELERQILNQDPALGSRRSPRRHVQVRRAAWFYVVGGILLAAAAIAVAVLSFRGGSEVVGLTGVSPNSVGVVDPRSNRLVAQVAVGSGPTAVAVGPTSVWVADAAQQELEAIDPRKLTVRLRVPLAAIPTNLAVGSHAVWATNPLDLSAGTISRFDPNKRTVTSVKVRTGPVSDLFAPSTPHVIALAGATVWTDTLHDRLVRISGGSRRSFDLGRGHSIDGIAVGARSIWVASSVDDVVLRVDARSGRLTVPPIKLADVPGRRSAGPSAASFGAGSVWIADALSNQVTRIDPRTNAVVATIPVGIRPTRIAVGAGGVWVLNAGSGTVSRIDSATNRVVATIPVGHTLTGIAVGFGRVWLSAAGGRAPSSVRPPAPARPLVTGSCGQVESGGTSPDLLIVSDLPTFDNSGATNAPILDMRHAMLKVLQERGFRAGPYRVGLQACTDSSPGKSPDLALCAKNAGAYAADASVVGVVGAYQSACSEVALPILAAAHSGPVAMISPTNTYVGLTHEGPQTAPDEPDRFYPTGVRNYVRLEAPDDAQGAALALLARQLGRHRLFLLDDGDPTSEAMVEYVSRAASRLGVGVAGHAHWGATGYDALARRIRRARSDAVVLTGCICSNGGHLLVALGRTLGTHTPLLASDNFTFAGNMAGPNAPRAAFGLYISSAGTEPVALSARARAFLHRAFPGRPLADIYPAVATAAAATQALVEAIGRSDGSRTSIVDELTHGRASGTILGNLTFDANGDSASEPVSIYRISRRAPAGPHRAVTGLVFDRVIEADGGLAAP